ncbi:putative lysosomal beta glucosidase [Phytophthora cinnamomi]|uniref:putative lysosomal beta glucosidase n=1 Tax=Phytophthora cinnamomi TaxID=4785 RepID=UPI00355AA4ED|nr:putative lysosomal beta glucosidase [Phytophthora cinnamomi]
MAFVYQGEDDDARAFEAALSFVEEFAYDVDTESFSAGGVSSEVDSSDSHEHARPKRRGRKQSREDPIKRRDALNAKRKLLRKAGVYGDPNRVRNQRTREIAFLREQIEKLELLRQGQGRVGLAIANAPQSLRLSFTSNVRTSVWREFARRQKRRREEAEATNVRLRLAVDRHQKLGQALTRLMRKRASQLENEYASFSDALGCGQGAQDLMALLSEA